MRPYTRWSVNLVILFASVFVPERSFAQSLAAAFAPDYFIVKAHEGVVSTVHPDGRMSFTLTQNADAPPSAVIAELMVADLLEECGATGITPLVGVELAGELLALAIQNGVMRRYRVDVPVGTDIVFTTELLSLFVSHLEYACPAWYGELIQTSDTFFDEQWSLHNTGQPLNFPCPTLPHFPVGCGLCGNGEGLMGTTDSDIDAPEAWSVETGSPDVVVAVLDTGADMDHPDLIGKLVSGHNYLKGECSDACDLPDDPDNSCPAIPCETFTGSHGTFIAGIVGAATNNGQGIAGVSPGARVMPLRVAGTNGVPELQAVCEALLDAAMDPDVRVINISFTIDKFPGAIDGEIATAFQWGKLIVAGAGNCWNPLPCTLPVSYPASHEMVMAVTSTNFNDERACTAQMGPELSVAAPGEDIVSTVNPGLGIDCNPTTDPDFYCRMNGTSWAAPHVAGLAALIWSVDPGLTNEDVWRIIEATADDLGAPGHDSEFGCGRINARRALARVLCPANIDDADCVVGVLDFLMLLSRWGPCEDQCCPADIDGDGAVAVVDFLQLLGAWGACDPECPPPLSLQEEIQAAGLTQAEWNVLQDCVLNGTEAESTNCACWMEHYLSCHRDPECIGTDPVLCSGADPLGRH